MAFLFKRLCIPINSFYLVRIYQNKHVYLKKLEVKHNYSGIVLSGLYFQINTNYQYSR